MRAADRAGLWPEALDLLDHLSDERKGALAEIATEPSRMSLARLSVVEDPAALAAILDTAGRYDLWASLLPIVDHLPAGSRDTVASLAAGFDPAVLERIVAVAGDHDLWSSLLPLLTLNAALQDRLVPVFSRLGPNERAQAASRAREVGVSGRLGSLGTVLGGG